MRRLINTQVVLQEHPEGWYAIDQKLFAGKAGTHGWDIRKYEGATLVKTLPETTSRGVALLRLAGNNYDRTKGSEVLGGVGRSCYGSDSGTPLQQATYWVTRKYDPRKKV